MEYEIVKKIGKGAYGEAFLLKNGRVLKVTKNKDEYELALRLIKDKPKWSAKIYSAEKKERKYYIVKEFVNPIYPDKERGQYNQDERFTFWGDTKKINEIFVKNIGVFEKYEPLSTQFHKRKLAATPQKICKPSEWGEYYYVRKLTKSEIELTQKVYDKHDKRINKWFMENYWNVYKYGGVYKGDLYSNIGITKSNKLVFFDLS